MRNILGRGFRENQNTHFMFNNLSLKIMPLMRCGKNVVEPAGHR
jgi:hypothetical protein